MPSVLFTLLVGNQEEHPACKNRVMGCWCGYLSAVRCKRFAYGPADATAIQPSLASLKCRMFVEICKNVEQKTSVHTAVNKSVNLLVVSSIGITFLVTVSLFCTTLCLGNVMYVCEEFKLAVRLIAVVTTLLEFTLCSMFVFVHHYSGPCSNIVI